DRADPPESRACAGGRGHPRDRRQWLTATDRGRFPVRLGRTHGHGAPSDRYRAARLGDRDVQGWNVRGRGSVLCRERHWLCRDPGFADDRIGVTIRHDDPDIWAMSSHRHARARRGRRAIWVVSICAVVLIAMAGTAAYAGYRYEQNRSERILPGVR